MSNITYVPFNLNSDPKKEIHPKYNKQQITNYNLPKFPLLDHIKSAFIEVNDLCPLCSYKFPLSSVNEYAKNNGIFCLPVCHKIFCQQNVTYRYTSQTSMANAGMNLGTIYFMLFMLPCLFLSATKLLPLWVPSSYTLKCIYYLW